MIISKKSQLKTQLLMNYLLNKILENKSRPSKFKEIHSGSSEPMSASNSKLFRVSLLERLI